MIQQECALSIAIASIQHRHGAEMRRQLRIRPKTMPSMEQSEIQRIFNLQRLQNEQRIPPFAPQPQLLPQLRNVGFFPNLGFDNGFGS